MAATFAATNAVVKGSSPTGVDYFIPELWSDEVLAAHKANLVMQQLVKSMPFSGKKGDTVRVPIPVRASASVKAAANAVTLITASDTKFDLVIDQHYEYSRLIEDIVSVQANDSLRSFYTDDAGYALAIQEDTALHSEGAKFAAPDAAPTVAGAAYSKAVIGGDGATVWSQASSGNGTALTDAGIRRAIQALDDNNVPDRMRALVIPPIEKRKLLGISRFTEQAFVGDGSSIRNGLIGDVYGIPVFVSTNCATVEANDSTQYRACLMFQKDAIVMAEQITPRTQTQPKLEFLADLFVADVLYGLGTPRSENGVGLIVPNS
jgi:N4-gp56 family major capsid protein